MKKKLKKKIIFMLLTFLLGYLRQIFAAQCRYVNASGNTDIIDALMVAQYSAEIISRLSCAGITPTRTATPTSTPAAVIISHPKAGPNGVVVDHAGRRQVIDGYPVMMPEAFNFDDAYSDPTFNDPVAASHISYIGRHLYGGGLREHTNAIVAINRGTSPVNQQFVVRN